MLKQDTFCKITVEFEGKKHKIELQKTLFKSFWLIYNNKSFSRTVTITEISNRIRKLIRGYHGKTNS